MLDLFDAPLLPGLATASDLVSAAEERTLVAAIDAHDLKPFRFQQWSGKRLTLSFGWNYDFEAGALGRADPMPPWLLDLRDRMATFASLNPVTLVQALLIRYPVGAGIGWHRDRPIYDQVLGLSLGVPATMRFRRRDGGRWARVSLPLEPRGAYHINGEARQDWEHSIAEMDRVRHSITFRTLSTAGHRLTSLTA